MNLYGTDSSASTEAHETTRWSTCIHCGWRQQGWHRCEDCGAAKPREGIGEPKQRVALAVIYAATAAALTVVVYFCIVEPWTLAFLSAIAFVGVLGWAISVRWPDDPEDWSH